MFVSKTYFTDQISIEKHIAQAVEKLVKKSGS